MAVTDTYGANNTSQGTLSVEYYGITIETNLACTLITVTKSATCTATKAYLYSAASALLATGTFTGNDATFSYDLASVTKYYIVAASDDADHTGAYTTVTHPVAGTNVDCIGRCYVNPPAAVTELAAGYIHNVNSITTSSGPDFTKIQLQIGDAWKSGAGMQINIGDAWKQVAGMQVNIGDAWKTVF